MLDSNMAAVLTIIACNLGSKAHRNAIPMANPTSVHKLLSEKEKYIMLHR